MSRNLLILVLLMSGTGCSSTRPLLSTIVVTPPKLSFRQLPREDSWQWTPVAVTYSSESLIPPPCSPSPVRTVELAAFIETDECPAPQSSSEPVPAVTTVVSVPPTITPLENVTSPQWVNVSASSVEPVPFEITSPVQTASTAMLPTPVVRVESPTSTESGWKPTTKIAIKSPVQTSTAMRRDPDETTLPEVHRVLPVESPSTPALVSPDLSELLTEIRNQRQLIEALHRDLTRERSADDAAMDELEAAIDNLLVQAKSAPRELPTTLRK